MKKKKNRGLAGQALTMLIYMLIGAASAMLGLQELPVSFPVRLLVLMLAVYVSMVLQIAIHEAGHLVFGLLTGYRFSSYRIFSLMWIKEGGRLRFRRLSLAGTGGQCLMAPPDWREDYPYVLYNLGGVLMNLLSALLFWLLSLAVSPLWQMALRFAALIGLAYALLNGLPLRVGPIDNDGRNIVSIRKSPAARRAFWLQMKIAESSAAGQRLREMPAEWFRLPGDERCESSILAAVPVYRSQRLMDEQRFAEAAALQDELLAQDLPGLYLGLLRCDRVCCELLQGRAELPEQLLTKEQQRFMKSMKSYPSVLRTHYLLALLRDRDRGAADRLRADFERMARSYPYPAELAGERELMALADEKAN